MVPWLMLICWPAFMSNCSAAVSPACRWGLKTKMISAAVAIDAEQASSMLQIDRDKKPVRPIRPHAPSAEETAAHDAFLAKLKDPIWLKT